MKRRIKLLLSLLYLGAAGTLRFVRRLFAGREAGRCTVLYYHAVPDGERAEFERQMGALIQHAQPVACDHGEPLARGKLHAAVTFDDAFRSVVDNGLPVMRDRGIPFAIFAPSAQLGGPPEWEMGPGCPDGRETILTADELRALPQDLVTIGSHTRTHPRLPLLDDAAARTELASSREELESVLGRTIDLLAFPHGEYDERILDLCREAGYRRVYTITPGLTRFGDDEFATNRVPVDPSDGPLEFRLKLLGAYSWMRWASALERRLLGRRPAAAGSGR